jgi:uncharacterized protein YlxW (UPF0749 family)
VPDRHPAADGSAGERPDGTVAGRPDGSVPADGSSEGPVTPLPRRNPRPALLASLLGDTLDPGYAEAAARRGRVTGPAPSRGRLAGLWYLAAGVLAVGMVLGIAARATAQSAPGVERTRSALLDDVQSAQHRADELAASASDLAAQIRSTQAALGAARPLATVRALERAGGLTAVHGPGLRIQVDGSQGGSGSGVILDTDLQLLVNGLWASGAEAVTVGGVRLQTTSAIRQAGGAILVDNTPVFWPITVEAIGNPATLHVNFVGTEGFGRFSAFASLYGIRFDLTAQPDLTMPAAAAPDLRYASAAPTTR